MLALPELEAADLGGEPLTVIATTSIIGDVVAQVGGDAIALTVLMEPGQDPHSYEPSAGDLTTVSESDVVFVNGWNLEEGLADDLETIGEAAVIVPVSANIEPLEFGGHDHDEHGDEHGDDEHGDEHDDEHAHEHSGADPHTWFNVDHVKQWAANVEQVLSTLDPANAETYAANAEAYLAELDALETYVMDQVGAIPAENRLLVTNHDAFGYFADAYGFEVIGTVIPGASTLAEPSARDLAELIEEMEENGVCTIFTETTVSDTLAQTVAAELDGCETVQVLPLYTGSVGPEGSGAETYVDMFRANVDTIVDGLQ
ncbi:MAG: zinc ABC transporter substrate-binding protein [Chloroflexi bacterium]|nr:zinc ABC transporter substrate-binding protein [Chloroflexota bacterium]